MADFMAIAILEAGKVWQDALDEVREAIDFLKLVNRNLVRIIKDTSEIDENSDLKKRGALVLKLIYAGLFDQAYELASKKNVQEAELNKFLTLLT